MPAGGAGDRGRAADDVSPRVSIIEVMLENEPAAAHLPLLFLVADTGGGHRNAARERPLRGDEHAILRRTPGMREDAADRDRLHPAHGRLAAGL